MTITKEQARIALKRINLATSQHGSDYAVQCMVEQHADDFRAALQSIIDAPEEPASGKCDCAELVEALEQVRSDAAINHNGLPPSQVMGNLLGYIEDTATKALTAHREKAGK